MRESGGLNLTLADEAATRAAGAALARALTAVDADRALLTLSGELGAGKTTLARGFLGALGVAGLVRSPTYTLVESYPAATVTIHHFDWYRLGRPEDLDGLGFRELLGPGNWILVEWPERAPAAAAAADLAVRLERVPAGRRMGISAGTPTGRAVVAGLKTDKALG